jgi:hypothetical protein
MAITNAIPEVWAARIKANLLNAHVYGAPGIVNREYEGDIADYGDTVHIIGVSPVTIKAYTKNSTIASPDALTDNETALTIDQAFYFNFAIDDIDVVQTRPKLMDEASRTAAWGLRDESDTYISAQMAGDATNDLGPQTITAAGAAYELLVDLGTALTQDNAPLEGRWVVCPPDFYAVILKDDRFLHATAVGDANLANGLVGRAAGFDIYQSNQAPTGATVIAGHPMAFSFAEQILKTEAYRPQTLFADALRGLYVFGAKTVYPDLLGTFTYTINLA